MALNVKAAKMSAGGRAMPGVGYRGNGGYRGDPGIFGDILGGISKVASFVPGVGGAISAATGGLANLLGRQRKSVMPTMSAAMQPPLGGFMQPPQRGPTGPTFGQRFKMAGQTLIPGGVEPFAGGGCGKGYRPNKSSYFLSDGTFVAAGTRCVKIRKRNPLNPRALDRAISRLSSAKKASTNIGRVTIRAKKCPA